MNTKPTIVIMGHGAQGRIMRAGGVPKPLSQNLLNAWQTVEKKSIHGVLLLGGGDVSPKLYGEKADPSCYGMSDARDEAEWYVLEEARERGIPILGICRGSQMMNVHAGGTLHQNIQSLERTHAFHQGCDARVVAVKGSRLAKAWQKREQWSIHIHHQAVKDVAPGMVAAAYAHDGTIEAIESVSGWELGVQFHPEMDDKTAAHQRIFNRFVLAAARNAGLPDTVPALVKPQAAYSYGGNMGTSSTRTPMALVAPKGTHKRNSNPVTSAWRCGQCAVTFDHKIDFVDHMEVLHEQMAEVIS